MKLGSYGDQGKELPGLIIEGELVDLTEALTLIGVALPAPSVIGFLQLADWRELGQRIEQSGAPGARRIAAHVRVGAPIPVPGKLLAAGANTHSHVAEARQLTKGVPPKEPMILAKANSCVIGPQDSIVRPKQTKKLDYEVELAVVIGRQARAVSVSEAQEVIAGYMISNDVSARDVQLSEHEDNPFYRTHFLGKSFDTFCPTGPFLASIEDVPDIQQARLRTWVNGGLRQEGSVDDLCHPFAKLVSYISEVMTLLPGDTICTGSPSGVAAFMSPPAYLEPGDVVECEIQGLGMMRNVIVDAA